MPLCGAPSGSHSDALHTIVTLSKDLPTPQEALDVGPIDEPLHRVLYVRSNTNCNHFLQRPVLLDEEGPWETTLSIKGVPVLRRTGLSSVQDATLISARTSCALEAAHSSAFAH